MTGRNAHFTSAQKAALILLGGGGLGTLVVLSLLVYANSLNPQPPAIALVAARITLSPRPPAATRLPSATSLPSATVTASNSPSPTQSPTVTLTPTTTKSPTSTPTRTRTPTPSSTPLWLTPVPATWAAATPKGPLPPTLADFWIGRAAWQLDVPDVGLPVGESDTLIGSDGQLWSYLHASTDSLGIHDQWGAYVPFPGCVTLWQSGNKGRSFHLFDPHCLIACLDKPCDDGPDDIDVQQYPRVARSEAGTWVMVYEWRGQVYLRTSADGLNWARSRHVPDTGIWPAGVKSCTAYQNIGQHPNVPPGAEPYNCLVGGPPGLFVQGGLMWVFVAMGQNPGHMGCYSGLIDDGAAGLRPCSANPLFAGANSYGSQDAVGPAANPYFDFSIISAADLLRVGDRYYMTYEGVRGPGPGDAGDTQFNLGFARSATNQIDGPWEKYPTNPVLGAVPGNVGLGHADLIVLDGVTYLYTATSGSTRGRYILRWK